MKKLFNSKDEPNVPAGHGFANFEVCPSKQKKPFGQSSGSLPGSQYFPAGHGLEVQSESSSLFSSGL